MSNIHRNIYRFRKANFMSMEELGTKIGTTKQTIKRYESGEIKNIPYDRIIDLANALGVSPVILMGLEPDTRELNSDTAIEDMELLSNYSKLNDDDKNLIKNMINSLLEKYK